MGREEKISEEMIALIERENERYGAMPLKVQVMRLRHAIKTILRGLDDSHIGTTRIILGAALSTRADQYDM